MVPEVSETELNDVDGSEDNEDMLDLRGNFEKLTCKPVEDDYALLVFDAKNVEVLEKIIEVDIPNYGVSFMGLINKETMKFRMPLESDLANVQLKDIKILMPQPKINWTQNVYISNACRFVILRCKF